jgi:hypothetical protein
VQENWAVHSGSGDRSGHRLASWHNPAFAAGADRRINTAAKKATPSRLRPGKAVRDAQRERRRVRAAWKTIRGRNATRGGRRVRSSRRPMSSPSSHASGSHGRRGLARSREERRGTPVPNRGHQRTSLMTESQAGIAPREMRRAGLDDPLSNATLVVERAEDPVGLPYGSGPRSTDIRDSLRHHSPRRCDKRVLAKPGWRHRRNPLDPPEDRSESDPDSSGEADPSEGRPTLVPQRACQRVRGGRVRGTAFRRLRADGRCNRSAAGSSR